MINILTIIGARPQIIKAAALSRTIKSKFINQINEIIVHTGQHYDQNMSEVFFSELEIPKPDYNLNVGSAGHGEQTAKMINRIENILLELKPDYVILYGDTNSTLAGAIAASKNHTPIVHIEAGLRSFNKFMPEEINRILCDHVSTLLFSPTKTGYNNLLNEGFKEYRGVYTFNKPGIFHSGDVMYDNSIFFEDKAKKESSIINNLKLKENSFILATIHRNQNTDNIERLQQIFDGLLEIIDKYKLEIVLPLHPRTKKVLNQLSATTLKSIKINKKFKVIEPVSFLDMISLEKASVMIITDSGGVQKEAYFFQKPCVILRDETEWVELLESGTSILANADKEKILKSVKYLLNAELKFTNIFGDANASEFICKTIINNFKV